MFVSNISKLLVQLQISEATSLETIVVKTLYSSLIKQLKDNPFSTGRINEDRTLNQENTSSV